MADSASHDATDAKVPDDATDTDKVPGVPESPATATDASDDDTFLDFTLPSLDDHAARLAEHPAWPWVTMSMEDGAVEVDYMGLTVG